MKLGFTDGAVLGSLLTVLECLDGRIDFEDCWKGSGKAVIASTCETLRIIIIYMLKRNEPYRG